MRKYVLIFGLLSLSVLAWGQADRPDLNQIRDRVAITIQSLEDIQKLAQAHIVLERSESLMQGSGEIYAYATLQEVEVIRNLGFRVASAPVTIGEDTREVSYHTYTTLTQELKDLAALYPKLARVESIGTSVQGREIWVMKISDNVEQDEDEPEVKYVAAMHGDEVVGKELMMYLIRHLLENYGKDAAITQLVNDLEIWILPSVNPDGTEAKRRYNANWVDLNRNFPDPQDDPNNTPNGRAIETQRIMAFTAAHNFCLSLNFHGGAVCVNYPWDTQAGDVPDIALTKYLALGYSKLNPPMYNSSSFPNGVTNGYAWYEVNGGMQDWSYHWYSDLDFTVELSQSKWPSASMLAQYWEENRAALLWFLGQARRGVRGIVTDAVTGRPVQAEINVVEINKPVHSSSALGDYHRVLLAGTYTIRVSASGYQERVFNNVTVADSATTATVLNVALQPR